MDWESGRGVDSEIRAYRYSIEMILRNSVAGKKRRKTLKGEMQDRNFVEGIFAKAS